MKATTAETLLHLIQKEYNHARSLKESYSKMLDRALKVYSEDNEEEMKEVKLLEQKYKDFSADEVMIYVIVLNLDKAEDTEDYTSRLLSNYRLHQVDERLQKELES